MLVSLAMKRANRFGLLSALGVTAALVWTGVRFYLMIDGENQAALRPARTAGGGSCRVYRNSSVAVPKLASRSLHAPFDFHIAHGPIAVLVQGS